MDSSDVRISDSTLATGTTPGRRLQRHRIEEEVMEQTFEILINELVADEEFRDSFLPLCESEIHALTTVDRSRWDQLAEEVDARLQLAASLARIVHPLCGLGIAASQFRALTGAASSRFNELRSLRSGTVAARRVTRPSLLEAGP